MGYARCNVQPNRDGKKILPQKNWKVPVDINEGKTITFKFNYVWTQNNCTISNIEWYPTQLVNGEWTSQNIAFDDTTDIDFFNQPNKIAIKFGGSSATISSDATLNSGNVTDSGSETELTVNNISAAYLSASFTYSYTVKYENEKWVEVNNGDEPDEYSFIEYFIKIDNIRIPKTSKYENNVIFTEAAVEELIDNIKKYPVTSIEGATPTGQQPYITVHHGSDSNTTGTKIKVGSVITFPASQNSDSTGTFRVSIDGTESVVPIKGFDSGSSGSINLGGDLIPGADNSYDIGTIPYEYILATTYNANKIYYIESNGNFVEADPQPTSITSGQTTYYIKTIDPNNIYRWQDLYLSGTLGDANYPIPEGYFDKITINSSTLNITNTVDGIKQGNSSDATNGFNSDYTGTYYGDTRASIYTKGGIYAEKNIIAARVFNAVFNDYAECRSTIGLAPGHVVIDQDDGSLACSSKRLQPGAQVISDTYGHLMGQTENATTPIAVAGRVLVYTYQPRENYHAGMAVCSAPDGTVDIMSRAEICEYPDCIVGIVSEIPDYEIWGSDNVKVDGRIWIKVR